jgi:PiT family inorganic phosphate transporter
VLFAFSSQELQALIESLGLPPLPLVPVSSSQAVVGAILGIALVRGARGVRYRVLGGIALGWVVTPVAAGLIAFVGLFFLQNVFGLSVSQPPP